MIKIQPRGVCRLWPQFSTYFSEATPWQRMIRPLYASVSPLVMANTLEPDSSGPCEDNEAAPHQMFLTILAYYRLLAAKPEIEPC